MKPLKAPFPWFGGKSRIAQEVWSRLGNVPNYVEPFFGSGACLLARPWPVTNQIETVNDLDGMVANFWRAVSADPESVARCADWPVNENDLHARHAWLVSQKTSMQAQLEGDPGWHDPKIAGWWVWGMACWIGGGFCSGDGPWYQEDGILVRNGDAGRGVKRIIPHLGDTGRGVMRRIPHLGDTGRGVNRQRPNLSFQVYALTATANKQGVDGLISWFYALQSRLRRIRVCCGDWRRVLTETPTTTQGLTGIFLDPPYGANAGRDMDIYTEDGGDIAPAVRDWALAHGEDPMFRIALCGYESEHVMPNSWECLAWRTQGGYANTSDGPGRDNAARERIWFSPHCLRDVNTPLFAEVEGNE